MGESQPLEVPRTHREVGVWSPSPAIAALSGGSPCGDTLAEQKGLLINSGVETAIFSMDASAEAVITAA